MGRPRSRTWVKAVIIAMITPLGVAVQSSPSAAAACSMPVTPYTFTWTGNVNNEWTNPGNWDKDPVTVLSPSATSLRGPNDDIDDDMDPDTNRVYVCIPAGAEVHIGSDPLASERVYVKGIDIGPNATVELTKNNAQLYAMGTTELAPPGDPVAPDSIAQDGSAITAPVGGTLGGQGTFRIHGTVTMDASSQPARFTTRASSHLASGHRGSRGSWSSRPERPSS